MGQGMIPMLDAFFSQVEDGEIFRTSAPASSGLWRIYSGRVKEGWKSGGRLHREKSLEKETPPVLPGVFAYGKELENFVKLSMEGEPDER